MKRTVVRYSTKPEQTQENERLIAVVFEELRAKSPQGVRYLVLKLADGAFLHFSSVEDGARPVTALDAFRSFRKDIEGRCLEPPQAADASLIGNYRMLAQQ